MDKGNVLVIGNSGVGKSTLINAVLGEEKAETHWGPEGTTKELHIYENDVVPFRVIDTVGFEPSLFKEREAIGAVKKWSKESAEKGDEHSQINLIWFCVDGCAKKLFSKTIQNLSKATKLWKSVPIIVVITKSYSLPEREENIRMVNYAFASQKHGKELRLVLPVVASPLPIDESTIVAPSGIAELIDATNDLMPEGIQASKKDIDDYILGRKRWIAHSIIAGSTAAGAAAGFIPVPYSDAVLLAPIEIAEVKALAGVFNIPKNAEAKEFFDTLIEMGTVGVVAKEAISALKALPGVNLAASALNAVVAGVIVFALGEGAMVAFEKIYRGEESITSTGWLQDLMRKSVATNASATISSVVERIGENVTPKRIAEAIAETVGAPTGNLPERK